MVTAKELHEFANNFAEFEHMRSEAWRIVAIGYAKELDKKVLEILKQGENK